MAPCDLHGDYQSRVHEQLKQKLEGKCTRFGYIQEGSIEPVSVHMGAIEAQTFRGYVIFEVKCTAAMCNPAVGTIIRARVVNVNNFGLLCMSIDDNPQRQVMDIIIPKDMKSVTSAVDIRMIKVGDTVDVQLIGKKYELYSTKIVVVGVIQRVESSATASSKSSKKTPVMATASPSVTTDLTATMSAGPAASRLLMFDDEDDFTFDEEDEDDAEAQPDEDADAENQVEDEDEDAEADEDGAGVEDADEEAKEEAKEEKSKSDAESEEFEEEDEEGFEEDDEDDIHYSDDE